MSSASPPPVSFTRWPWWRRWFGTRSERSAATHLQRLGLRILARNVSNASGELDIIAWDARSRELVIVEVRSTSQHDLHDTILSVNHEKQRRLTDATTRYLQQHRLLGEVSVRFDILAVSWPPDTPAPRFEHIPHAFESVGRFQMWK
jgi:putative endonuclease